MQVRVRGQLDALGVNMQMLTLPLSQEFGRPVQDATGLTGQYDFKLRWVPDTAFMSDAHPGVPTQSDGAESLFTAVTDQLGLKLKSTKGLATVYVIEKIDRPSEN